MYIKVVCLLVCLVAVQAQNATRNHAGYHERYGIPAAERIRIQESVNSRISGGSNSYYAANTYMAGLLITLITGELSTCGGALLSQQRVLTAAACWDDGHKQGSQILVVLGSTLLYSGGLRKEAKEVRTHPDYDPFETKYNLAMIVIDPAYSNGFLIKPMMLPSGMYLSNTFTNSYASVLGYGISGPASRSGTLREVNVRVLSTNECKRSYGPSLPRDVMCTSNGNGDGPCNGDVGGPLVLKNFDGKNNMLIGVVLTGPPSGCGGGEPSQYTRVTEYIRWIQQQMY
ncbi:collagenase-like [Anticarsia gemmatalis]|uniref:collagenase-like n=1 Tax=Anticarsia gemmatalis TaxID=129554 RepID=UPI003F7734CB